MDKNLTLHSAFNRRYNSIVERSLYWKVTPPDREALYQKVEDAFLNGFKCCYCQRELKITEPYPSLSVFSLDHDLPFARNGYNNLNNIVICCHSCNIIKGTLRGETYRELLSYIPVSLKDKMFMEIYKGRIADKLERVSLEKNA